MHTGVKRIRAIYTATLVMIGRLVADFAVLSSNGRLVKLHGFLAKCCQEHRVQLDTATCVLGPNFAVELISYPSEWVPTERVLGKSPQAIAF